MGASSGVVVGIAFLVNNISSAIYMGIYSVAGLVGGTLNKLGKYLNLNSAQSEEVGYICDYFSTQMSKATTAKKDKEAKLRNAVYGNLKLMRKTLSAEQYAKYAALMNITLQNKGIELNK